jgi:ribosome maturation factor RimP
MISKEEISSVINQKLGSSELFLIDVYIKPGNRILVLIDGDNGVSVNDCMNLSRYIASVFDRDTEDYELEVSSAGIGQPLSQIRQFRKNTGRKLKVVLKDGSEYQGILSASGEENLTLILPANKRKKEEEQVKELNYADIKEAKVEVSFK